MVTRRTFPENRSAPEIPVFNPGGGSRPQIYPSPSTESWLGSSTAFDLDVRGDRVGAARPPGEVWHGWAGSTDDPKAPEPQLMPPSVTRWFAPQPLSGRVGGESETWAEP